MTNGVKTNDNTQPVVTDVGTGQVGFYETKIWSGVDDPFYKKNENMYSMISSSWSDKVLTWTDIYEPNVVKTATYRGLLSDHSGYAVRPIEPTWDANDEIDFILQLKKAMTGNGFHLASSVGAEGKDALKQITGAATSLAKGIFELRKGNFHAAASAVGLTAGKRKATGKQLTGNVLAIQLGMLPLISDLKSGAEALADILHGPKRHKVKISKVKNGYYHEIYRPDLRCGYIRRIESLIWSQTSELTISERLSLADVPTMLYNAVPLSFVLDWVIPIGNYLEAAMFSQFALSGQGVRTTFIKGRAEVGNPTDVKKSYGYVNSVSGAHYTESMVSVGRSIVVDLPVPLPRVKTLSSVPSFRRALTAVSLIGQRLL